MPARLGRYAVRRRIGSGGFATVWLAYDEHLDSPVAVKVLADNWTEDHHVRQRFLEEGRFLRKVESPYVVTVYDAGELDDGRPYLVMSYADQGTLAERLESDGLTPGQTLEVVRQVGQGLTALHVRGVLHRDVKPANVLFRTVDGSAGPGGTPRVQAMLADLGLGKALDISSRLTMIGGTPTFVAPEQAQGERLSPAADQYSLAALTFLLLTGRAPYEHGSLQAAANPGPPPALSTPERPFPPAVEAVVRRGLAADPDDRWPDVAAFVAALEQALPDADRAALPEPWIPLDPDLTQPGARPTPEPLHGPLPEPDLPPRGRGSRRRTALGAAAAVLALLAGLAGGYAVRQAMVSQETLTDESGSLEVTVPRDWAAAVSTAAWVPPKQSTPYSALSAGTAAGWTSAGSRQEGVFLGVFGGEEMPEKLPGHAECAEAQEVVRDVVDEGATLTQVHTGCPGVIVERVVQVATNRFLWVQVRAHSTATANHVLDAVGVSGY